jgi:hypothetical protein
MKHMTWVMGMIWAGCGVSADLATVVQADTEPEPNKCGPSACGVNDPGIDAHGFHSVSKSGWPNEKGFKLVDFKKDGLSYQLDVVDGYLTGSRMPMVLAGQALVGARLILEASGESWEVRIARVGSMEFPVGDPDPIETYVLQYTATGGSEWRNLCGMGAGVVDPGPDAMGMKPAESILYSGDRLDLGSKTVAVDADHDWFNFGCAGHVVSKLHLTRNTLASTSAVPGPVSFPGRQATLKMLTADYCGDGTAFTVAGQRLVWQGGQVQYLEPPVTMEASWSEYGARCLNIPRMAVPTTSAGSLAFPDIWGAILARCQPQPCWESLTVTPAANSGSTPIPGVEQRVSGNTTAVLPDPLPDQ